MVCATAKIFTSLGIERSMYYYWYMTMCSCRTSTIYIWAYFNNNLFTIICLEYTFVSSAYLFISQQVINRFNLYFIQLSGFTHTYHACNFLSKPLIMYSIWHKHVGTHTCLACVLTNGNSFSSRKITYVFNFGLPWILYKKQTCKSESEIWKTLMYV